MPIDNNQSPPSRGSHLTALVAAAIATLLIHPRAEQDFQSWQWFTFDLLNREPWRIHLYADNRIADDLSRERATLIGPRIHYRLFPWLQTGAGYLYINSRNLREGNWNHEHRLENELNARFPLTPRLGFDNRNRVETRWRENRSLAFRSRHRAQIRYQINRGALRSAYLNNEFFYDFERDEYSENRVIPIGLDFRLNEHLDLGVFYMIQSLRLPRTGHWDHNHIFGTHLRVRF